MGRLVPLKLWHQIYMDHHGPLPWKCADCDGPLITKMGRHRGDGHIHHVDGNQENNAIENLIALHNECHRRRHTLGVKKSAATRVRMSIVKQGDRNPAKQFVTCEYCKRLVSVAWIKRHHKSACKVGFAGSNRRSLGVGHPARDPVSRATWIAALVAAKKRGNK